MKTFLLVGDTLLAEEVWMSRVDSVKFNAGSVGGAAEPERRKYL